MESDPIIHHALLAIDAGNTRIKWGVGDRGRWVATGAVESARSDRIAEAWAGLPPIERAVASNVAGAGVERDLLRACESRGIRLDVFAARAEQLGVVNGYRDPRQLGSDRWAALVAAHALGGGNKLVVNVGTALTADALAADGRFLGGIIVPGPGLMARSLGEGTAGLPLAKGEFADFPATTADAIATGALHACIGAIVRMGDAMAGRGLAPERVVISGGAAQRIAALLPIPFAIHENLVLDGLALMARNS